MENSLNFSTHAALGFAFQSDPFQAGREAAQMAKSQLTQENPSLVLAVGPCKGLFQDFLEGVRLVTGEETLVGIPVDRMVSNDLFAPETCVVLMLASQTSKFSLAYAPFHKSHMEPVTTRLISQLRNARRDIRSQYDCHGVVLIQNKAQHDGKLPNQIISQMGLDSWLLSFSCQQKESTPLICQDQMLSEGVVAIECFSQVPWGLSIVETEPFKDNPSIVQEAVKIGLRDAHKKMGEQTPVMGFILFNCPVKSLSDSDFGNIFKMSQLFLKDIPFLGMMIENPFLQVDARMNFNTKESILVMLIPH